MSASTQCRFRRITSYEAGSLDLRQSRRQAIQVVEPEIRSRAGSPTGCRAVCLADAAGGCPAQTGFFLAAPQESMGFCFHPQVEAHASGGNSRTQAARPPKSAGQAGYRAQACGRSGNCRASDAASSGTCGKSETRGCDPAGHARIVAGPCGCKTHCRTSPCARPPPRGFSVSAFGSAGSTNLVGGRFSSGHGRNGRFGKIGSRRHRCRSRPQIESSGACAAGGSPGVFKGSRIASHPGPRPAGHSSASTCRRLAFGAGFALPPDRLERGSGLASLLRGCVSRRILGVAAAFGVRDRPRGARRPIAGGL